MRRAAVMSVGLMLAACATASPPQIDEPLPFNAPFREEILAFAAQDGERAPERCSILFVGSSSIRLWSTLEGDMAPLPVINRGFGGSTLAQVNLYFDRVVTAYRPRAIVLYAGENDIDAGAAPDAVTHELQRFMELKRERLGRDVPVFYIAMKPSILRAGQRDRQQAGNAAIAALAAAPDDDLHFIDVATPMLQRGLPPTLFVEDGLHMSPEGYAIWRELVTDALTRSGAASRRC